jgi:hypothetical protein
MEEAFPDSNFMSDEARHQLVQARGSGVGVN